MAKRNDTREVTVTTEAALRQVHGYIRVIAENPVPGTPAGAVLEDALSSTGKMIRPRLLLLCGAFGPDYFGRLDRLCLLAALVELTHLASLIHDDIIDNAPFRRGKPTTQDKYGKDAAVYAGDFLISRVNYWEAKEGLNDAAVCLAGTMEDMCVGEIGQSRCRYREDVTAEAYYSNIRGKTASLFKSACGIGAAEAGCPDGMVETLERIGECLGLLFQLRDDLLDFTSTQREAGKLTHKDFRDGIYTLPVLMAARSPEGRAALLPIMGENRRRVLTDLEIGQMERSVVRFGGVEATWGEIHRLGRLCAGMLDSLPEDGPVRKLRRMLERLEGQERE